MVQSSLRDAVRRLSGTRRWKRRAIISRPYNVVYAARVRSMRSAAIAQQRQFSKHARSHSKGSVLVNDQRNLIAVPSRK
jgi:hypothetical protein